MHMGPFTPESLLIKSAEHWKEEKGFGEADSKIKLLGGVYVQRQISNTIGDESFRINNNSSWKLSEGEGYQMRKRCVLLGLKSIRATEDTRREEVTKHVTLVFRVSVSVARSRRARWLSIEGL